MLQRIFLEAILKKIYPMTNYKFGEILLLLFPYSEGIGETKRPVILLAVSDKEDIIVSKVTSSEKRGKYDIIINNWKEVGLLFPSVIRVDKIATLSRSRIYKKLGILDSSYYSLIKNKIKQLFKIE